MADTALHLSIVIFGLALGVRLLDLILDLLPGGGTDNADPD